MLSEQDECRLVELLGETTRGADVTIPAANLAQLLSETRDLRYGLVRERQDATVREYGIATLPAGVPARPPVLDDLTETAAVTVTLEDLVEGVSRITVNQAAAWPWNDNPWFTRGAA